MFECKHGLTTLPAHIPLSLPPAMRVMTIPVDSMTKPVLRATEISKFYTLHMMPLQIDID